MANQAYEPETPVLNALLIHHGGTEDTELHGDSAIPEVSDWLSEISVFSVPPW